VERRRRSITEKGYENLTRKKALGSIKVDLVRGKNVRPQIEEHFTELLYVTSMEVYQERKSTIDIIVFDNDTIDLKNGKYYIIDTWASVFLSSAEFNEFHKKYGNTPTIAQKKNLRIPVVLIKFEVRNGTILIGEGDDPNKKIEISADMLIDNQVK